MGLITLPTQDLSNAPAQPFITLTGTSDVTGLPAGWPQSRNDFVRFWCGNLAYTLDFIANYANKKLAYRLAAAEWAEIATATPPQEYDLPLVDGISGTAKYSKDQFGIVRVHMAVVQDSGTITNNEILGTLPEGFRPKLSFAVVGYGNSNPNTISDRHTVNMYISSNGDITASFLSETDAAKLASLYGVTEFIAAS